MPPPWLKAMRSPGTAAAVPPGVGTWAPTSASTSKAASSGSRAGPEKGVTVADWVGYLVAGSPMWVDELAPASAH